MDQLLDTITHILEFHWDMAAWGAVLTFLTVLFTFYNKVAIPMYNTTLKPVFNFFHSVASSPQRIDNLDTKLDLILGELKPNGGSSLKDQLNRLEASVSISEAQRLLILDANPNGVWTSDTDGNLVWMNNTLKVRCGATLDEVEGTGWINIIHPADRKLVLDEWEQAVKYKRVFNLHYRLTNLQTNQPITVHGVATPAKSYDGSVVGFNGVIYFS